MGIEGTCDHCKNVFIMSAEVDRALRKGRQSVAFCSHSCSALYHRPKLHVSVSCFLCGSVFVASKHQRRSEASGKPVFCSRECSDVSRANILRKNDIAACCDCGEDFILSRNQRANVREGKPNRCSVCQQHHKSELAKNMHANGYLLQGRPAVGLCRNGHELDGNRASDGSCRICQAARLKVWRLESSASISGKHCEWWAAKTREERYRIGVANYARNKEVLPDGFILNMLGLRVSDNMPSEYIEVKRLTIQLGRMIKNETTN